MFVLQYHLSTRSCSATVGRTAAYSHRRAKYLAVLDGCLDSNILLYMFSGESGESQRVVCCCSCASDTRERMLSLKKELNLTPSQTPKVTV